VELKPVIVAMTASGAELGRRLCSLWSGAQLHGYAPRVATADVLFDDTIAHLQGLYQADRPIIGICAAGILIRALAPVLADKHTEPAVVALSDSGEHVVPLLGGHAGNANQLAQHIAHAISATAAITTASDARFGIALDAPAPGFTLRNPEHHKAFAARLLAGAKLRIDNDAGVDLNWLAPLRDLAGDSSTPDSSLVILVTTADVDGDDSVLVYHPQVLALGVGCERNVEYAELADLVAQTLAAGGYARGAVAGIFSVSLKADEAALLALAQGWGVAVRFFEPARLEAETPRLPNPSEVVFREVGCHGVAEAAALAAAGPSASLVLEKHKSERATCAVALSDTILDACQIGRARGVLAVVGIGPGEAPSRSPAAGAAIANASHVVGYSLYLDLAADLLGDAHIQHRYGLGEESERVQHAIDLAAAGRHVALVCSGDAGVYAMASLTCELLDASVDDNAARIELEVYPGISAMQAAAACAGAPLGHDFCAISLSDLLTPRAVIEHRLQAAGVGDFVIALYNPISTKRVATFERSMQIIAEHRAPDTVVVVARNLGRPTQAVRILRLDELRAEDVDMLCVVIIGSSNTKTFAHAGQTLTYTPRGYHAPAGSAKLKAQG
jgi:cobalt-precorrin 5A hydrolase / precorrin-3B C17-methyltransferase